jgi:hypothetical protein
VRTRLTGSGGVLYAWSAWQTVLPLVLGIVGLIIFGLHTVYSSKYSKCDPLIRPSLFASISGLTAYFATVVHGIIVWCALYYIPLYSLIAKETTPVLAGISTTPYMATVAPSAAIVGLLITKYGKYRNFIWVGWVFITLGFGLNMLLERDTPTWKWVIIYLVGGTGLGILYSAQAFATQASASNADLPFSASMYAFCRNLGQCIGVAVGGVTFQNAFRKEIEKSDKFAKYAEELASDAVALVEIVKTLGDTMKDMKDVIVVGYVDALRVVWMVMCILAAVGLALVLLGIKDKNLDRELETDQGLVDRRSKVTTSYLSSDTEQV